MKKIKWLAKYIALPALVLMLLQLAAVQAVNHYFPVGTIHFPFASAGSAAGDGSNIIGVGNIRHSAAAAALLLGLSFLLLLLSINRSSWRFATWVPVAPIPGSLSNIAEGLMSGYVTDWIIIPGGKSSISAYSLGDIAAYVGLFLWIFFQIQNLSKRNVERPA